MSVHDLDTAEDYLKLKSEAHLSGRADFITQESSQSRNLAREVRQSPVVPQRDSMVHFGCIWSEEEMNHRRVITT